MRIDDLPHFKISRVDVASDEIRISGTFATVIGVRDGRSWLLLADSSFIGDLIQLDVQTKTATFITPD